MEIEKYERDGRPAVRIGVTLPDRYDLARTLPAAIGGLAALATVGLFAAALLAAILAFVVAAGVGYVAVGMLAQAVNSSPRTTRVEYVREVWNPEREYDDPCR
jgi:hypothetical protein